MGGYADYGAMGRHVFQHDAAGADLRPGADLDVAEDFRPGPDKHAVAHLGMSVAGLFASAAERHLVQHGNVVLDDRGLAHHHAGGVIDEDSLADPRRRMNVDPEYLGGAALQIKRQRLAPVSPEPMRGTICLQRVKALEVEKGSRIGRRRRIALSHRADIGAHGLADALVFFHGLGDQLTNQHRR